MLPYVLCEILKKSVFIRLFKELFRIMIQVFLHSKANAKSKTGKECHDVIVNVKYILTAFRANLDLGIFI